MKLTDIISSRLVLRYLTLISILVFILTAYLYNKKVGTLRKDSCSNSDQCTTLYKLYYNDLKRISRTVIDALHNQTSGEYIRIPNILTGLGHQSSDMARAMETVTWCTCCSESNLRHLQELVMEWKGPLSLTVFTTVSKLSRTLKHISALHQCDENIRQRVRFHLCLPAQSMANVSLEIPQDFSPAYCKKLLNIDGNYASNYVDKNVPFPVNVLRNMAIESCNTQYVLNADIDLRPSAGLYDALVDFTRTNPERSYSKTAFVLPSFEISRSSIKSLSKDRLIQLWETGAVRPFYSTVCYKCQNLTDYDRWKSLNSSESLKVAYHIHWIVPWEPYVLVNKALVPLFNEGFKQYGYNRISQVVSLTLSQTKKKKK